MTVLSTPRMRTVWYGWLYIAWAMGAVTGMIVGFGIGFFIAPHNAASTSRYSQLDTVDLSHVRTVQYDPTAPYGVKRGR